MHEIAMLDLHDKPAAYRELAAQLAALLAGERDVVACAANTASLLYWSLPDVNWAGFYFVEPASGDLVVGPFEGRPALRAHTTRQGSLRVPQPSTAGRSSCPTCTSSRGTSCDAASNSEVVVPILAGEPVPLGVLDLDSPRSARFDAADDRGLSSWSRSTSRQSRRPSDPCAGNPSRVRCTPRCASRRG